MNIAINTSNQAVSNLEERIATPVYQDRIDVILDMWNDYYSKRNNTKEMPYHWHWYAEIDKKNGDITVYLEERFLTLTTDVFVGKLKFLFDKDYVNEFMKKNRDPYRLGNSNSHFYQPNLEGSIGTLMVKLRHEWNDPISEDIAEKKKGRDVRSGFTFSQYPSGLVKNSSTGGVWLNEKYLEPVTRYAALFAIREVFRDLGTDSSFYNYLKSEIGI